MRITNKIMQRNNLNNINTNKIYQDSLSTQMSTQKKIARASDDPVVAIRALRLRSNVTEVTQFYSKNIPDAKSWLDITESALKNQSEVMTDMISQCTKGANGDLTSEDRGIILEQLQALSKEVYSTANADYAGRYVFTGYRTDTPLSFIKTQEQPYEIKEVLDRNALTATKKIESGNVLDWTSANFKKLSDAKEQTVEEVETYRLQLAYGECSTEVPPLIRYRDADGILQEMETTIMRSYESDPSPYKAASEDDDAAIYVPETGEILLGKNQYQKLMEVKDDITTTKDEGQIQVIYQKEKWNAGDLRPEHYFYCKSDPGTENEIEYNNSLKKGTDEIYNQFVSDREEALKEAREIREKYPDVPYKAKKDLDTIEKDEQKIIELQDEKAQLESRLPGLEAEKNALLGEINDLENERNQSNTTENRKDELDILIGEKESRIAELQKEMDRSGEIDAEIAALEEEIEDCKNREAMETDEQIVVPQEYMDELAAEIQEKREQIQELEDEKTSLETEKSELESERAGLYAEQDRLETSKEYVGMNSMELAEAKAALAERKTEISAEYEELGTELEALQEEYEAVGTTDERKAEIETRFDEIYLRRSQITDESDDIDTRDSIISDRMDQLSMRDGRVSELADLGLEGVALADEREALLAERGNPATSAARRNAIDVRLSEVNGRIGEIANRRQELSELIDRTDNWGDYIDRRLAAIDNRQNEISERIPQIDDRTAEIDEELDGSRSELAALLQKQEDLNAFNTDWEKVKQLTDEITFMDGDYENQAIEYDVGFNQTIRVNSTAGECFQHGIGRTVDDLVAALQEVSDLDQIRTKIKTALDAAQEGTAKHKKLKEQYQAADKALTLAKDKTQKMFESGITTFQRYLDDVSLSITNCGNRSKKLELIENRMQDQKTTFETLRSENEDVDIAETAIQLTSAQLTYEAALMATGKVSQNSLLQYI